MIVLAFSTGSRLDFVSQSRVFFLQTFLWILCATVCKAEQYFNVEDEKQVGKGRHLFRKLPAEKQVDNYQFLSNTDSKTEKQVSFSMERKKFLLNVSVDICEVY